MIGTGAVYNKERSACTLIDNKILVDCGNGIVKTLLEQDVDINQIDTLLITHLHGDHFLDIPFLIMQRGFNLSSSDLNIYCPIGTEETIGKLIVLAYADVSDWTILRDKARVKFVELEQLQNIEVSKGYFVDSYEVVHGDVKPAFGYVIKNADKAIGISGDSSYCENIDQIIQNSDVSVLDSTFIDGSGGHMGINVMDKLIKKYGKKIIATHMTTLAREYAKENKIENLIVPNDGDEFEI